ncbi:MarR family transcriptional regulator [Actinocorallia sp. A-T 12471]|uniref:GbsR/MarR family transcriptional regulator n=1 Tax=Actinocorallia sp. A-T 12471 TaxID=3089813 RepID=UPI0029CBA39E|nr:MarR family transcriptional regulator [Actinocorallia sp. A-T 12471]MDX6743898.1 MarR family transcriptional regulator [Actinocorallia sp. A-T 12471]
MTERDEPAVRDFVERMALAWAEMGFPKMAARVLMTFMAADAPVLTAAQLRDALDTSPAAISGAVRYLMHIGMLRRHPLPGSREHAYSLYEDTWYQVTVNSGFYTTMSGLTDDGVAAAGPDTEAGRRLAEMRDFFVFLEAEMGGLVDKWRRQRAAAENP